MTTQTLDWRALKKELFASPRPRTSSTFQHTDIFGAVLPLEQQRINNPTNQSGIGKITSKTPKRIRENDTTRSQLLDKSDTKNERVDRSVGKKTFESSSSIHLLRENLNTVNNICKVNPHVIPDHKDEWFFNQTAGLPENRHQASLYVSIAKEVDASPHRLRKQEEMYGTEIARTHALSPDGSKLNLMPRRKSELQIGNVTMDRSFCHQRTATEMRLKHNESNVLHEEDFKSKLEFPIHSLHKSRNNSSNGLHGDRSKSEFEPSEVNRIKRMNHNFSDIFGLEYGAREGVQHKKSQCRTLSTKLDWTKVDSILSEKDIGGHHKGVKTMNKSRSRLLDQKSSLDTHAEYDKPIIKLQRLTNDKTNFQRGGPIQKKKNW